MNNKGSITILALVVGGLILGGLFGAGLGLTNKYNLEKAILENQLENQIASIEASLGAIRPSGYAGKLLTRLTEGGSETTFNTSPSTLPDGTYLSASNIGDFVVITINPSGANQEKISASSVSVSSSTATWTIINRGLEFGSTTARTANKKAHSIGETVIISNDDQFLTTQYLDKDNPQTISQLWTYTTSPVVPTPTTDYQASTKKYADDLAIAGAPDATENVKGLVELGSQGNLNNASTTGSTSAKRVVPLDYFNATSSATTTVPVTKTDGKISQGFLDLTEGFTFSGGVTSTGALVQSGTSTFSGASTFTGSVTGAGAADIQTFTNTGTSTWTKPTNALVVEIYLFGAGGGGGGGSSSSGQAGEGGGGGGYSFTKIQASLLSATTSLRVGAGGAGGAAVATGTIGQATYFLNGTSTIAFAAGGIGGSGAGSTLGQGGNAFGHITQTGGAGGDGAGGGSAGTAGANTSSTISGRGGGGGGGHTGANAGGAGGAFVDFNGATIFAGGTPNGGAGTSLFTLFQMGGTGGAGGVGDGGAGGNGGTAAGGGGGGGSASAGGAGGNGGDGAALIITY